MFMIQSPIQMKRFVKKTAKRLHPKTPDPGRHQPTSAAEVRGKPEFFVHLAMLAALLLLYGTLNGTRDPAPRAGFRSCDRRPLAVQ
jgi:hypothetical protein